MGSMTRKLRKQERIKQEQEEDLIKQELVVLKEQFPEGKLVVPEEQFPEGKLVVPEEQFPEGKLVVPEEQFPEGKLREAVKDMSRAEAAAAWQRYYADRDLRQKPKYKKIKI
jgi:hypothetical protein